MEIRVGVKGTARVLERLKLYERRYPRALAAALYWEGGAVAKQAVHDTPRQTGWLASTAFVAPPPDQSRNARQFVTIGFGAEYALEVHEREATATGKPRFLFDAFMGRAARRSAHLIAERTKRYADAGIGVSGVRVPFPTTPPAGAPPPSRLKSRRVPPRR